MAHLRMFHNPSGLTSVPAHMTRRSYGAPAHMMSSSYGGPAPMMSSSYGAPPPMMSSSYGAPAPMMSSSYGGLLSMITFEPPIQEVSEVSCVFLTQKEGQHNFILAHSQRNAFEAFGGSIQYGTDPRDCMNNLLRNIGLRLSPYTQYIDLTNPANGKLTRIFVLYIDSISCRALNHSIQTNPVISGAFHYFTRFPIQNVIQSPHNPIDDRGIPRILTTFARDILQKLSHNYFEYIS